MIIMACKNYSRACKTKTSINSDLLQESSQIKHKLKNILLKDSADLSPEEEIFLKQNSSLVRILQARRRQQKLRKERLLEVEDSPVDVEKKCAQLVELIRASRYTIIYTGAGISTSASIPDYRGPNGVWTQLRNGAGTPKISDLALAEPTFTHMAIAELVTKKLVKHVVSQNCDGLHLRSGITTQSLSEIHGNMYLEVCRQCRSSYLRSFDVTERTALRRHETGRYCHYCPPEKGRLIDTIVHFSEKGKLQYPLKWDAAAEAAQKADLIICLGSSLQVLKSYRCLWPQRKRGNLKLVIVNLQWTPKDSQATLKINAKCDQVMQLVMKGLGMKVRPYDRKHDPIYCKHIPLRPEEETTCNRVKLDQIQNQPDPSNKQFSPGWYGKGIRKKG